MTEDAGDTDTYALKGPRRCPRSRPPTCPTARRCPKSYRPRIGVIGTGGISASHLDAYRTAGWEVAALWNRTRAKAEAKAAEYCPAARIEDDWQDMLADAEIDVIDVTLHPEHRAPIIEAALKAGKHVLSQKPFVTDLGVGEDLVKLAEDRA
jgi:predicted dehydrogenase